VSEFARIIDATHHDPFSLLGKHPTENGDQIRVFLPGASDVSIEDGRFPMSRIEGTDMFEWHGDIGAVPEHYRIYWHENGEQHSSYDPYSFPPQLSEYDLHLFGEGNHWHAYRLLGARPHHVDGIEGVLFATWAPNAERISIVGDFNNWDGRRHPMQVRGGSGVWELFIPGLAAGTIYKFEIRNRHRGDVFLKSDPYGQAFEMRPSTASTVAPLSDYAWQDADWLEKRKSADWLHAPLSIYEVHLGSWRRTAENEFMNYRDLAHQLVEYVQYMNFTHIELLPVTEHPLDASWGYQTTGYYAPTSRFGTPDDFRYFVNHCHEHGIGVFMDWAPAHFPKDAHGLARFDGEAIYEHEDPRRGEHRDWGTLIFNYGRNEVKNFLLSSATYWLEEFHIDGLRVDAVASMLYLNYSREDGDWIPNQYGGCENLEAIEFLKQLNTVTHELQPGTLIMAEESTDWPMVSRPTYLGGLGFSMKWNMGWMHDSLDYMQQDPVYRQYHHNNLTFGQLYAYNENFILPFSHDEVVHGKGSMIHKMPGDDWQRFANLRLLYTYMYTIPGKQLLFMGNEFAQRPEWRDYEQLEWHVCDNPLHQGLQLTVKDLNHLNRDYAPLHRYDFEPQGFSWIDCHDSAQSTLSYLRTDGIDAMIIILNLTPVPRYNYRIGVPEAGSYAEIFNSDSQYYGGSNISNGTEIHSQDWAWMNQPCSVELTLPPLAGVILKKV